DRRADEVTGADNGDGGIAMFGHWAPPRFPCRVRLKNEPVNYSLPALGSRSAMRWRELGNEPCSVARTVSVIGDRWTLLVLRDCSLGVRRLEAFQARLGMPRPVLAARLRKLVQAGVLRKRRYRLRPPRYEYRLTKKGLELYPVMMAIVHWG